MASIPGIANVALNTVGEAIAFAAGVAIGPTLSPVSTALVQEAWKVAQIKAVDPGTAAGIVAEAVAEMPWGKEEAAQHGIDGSRFEKMVGEEFNAPGLGELYRMWRRDAISDDLFLHGLRKAKFPEEWDHGLTALRTERLSPQDLATMAQRSVVPNDGLLPVTFDHSGSNVTPMPIAQIDTLKEAAASGYDHERLAALARIVGLPPAPGELLQLLNRGAINVDAYRLGISEGNTRNEWADKLMVLRRRLLTPHEYAELQLRGIIEPDAMHKGAALSGMENADTDLLFQMLGRPLPVHQIATGLARGGKYGGGYDTVPEPYRDAIRRSSIRPEYAHLAYANRYTLPGAFVLRTLAQAGDLTPQETHTLLLESGWPPDLAQKVSARWTGETKSTANKHVNSAETGLFTVLRKAYVNDEATEAQAAPILTDLGVPVADHARVFALWGHERALVRSSLTPTQIKKAVGQPGKDHAWAHSRLLELGYTAADAETFLNE